MYATDPTLYGATLPQREIPFVNPFFFTGQYPYMPWQTMQGFPMQQVTGFPWQGFQQGFQQGFPWQGLQRQIPQTFQQGYAPYFTQPYGYVPYGQYYNHPLYNWQRMFAQ